MMKIKIGVAGITPSKDSFPVFTSTKKWVCLYWDADTLPAAWCVGLHDHAPSWFHNAIQHIDTNNTHNSHNNNTNIQNSHVTNNSVTGHLPSLLESSLYPLPEIKTAWKSIPICNISDIFLDTHPHELFRLYCGKEVVQFKPVTSYNVLCRRAGCWADAIYSAMELQTERDPELVLLYKHEFSMLLQQQYTQQQQQDGIQDGVQDGSTEHNINNSSTGSNSSNLSLIHI